MPIGGVIGIGLIFGAIFALFIIASGIFKTEGLSGCSTLMTFLALSCLGGALSSIITAIIALVVTVTVGFNFDDNMLTGLVFAYLIQVLGAFCGLLVVTVHNGIRGKGYKVTIGD